VHLRPGNSGAAHLPNWAGPARCHEGPEKGNSGRAVRPWPPSALRRKRTSRQQFHSSSPALKTLTRNWLQPNGTSRSGPPRLGQVISTRRVICSLLSQYVFLLAMETSFAAGWILPDRSTARDVIVCSPSEGDQSKCQKRQAN